MKLILQSLCIGALAMCLTSCGESEKAAKPGNEKPVVHAVNYPLFYFAQRIAGDLIELHCPAAEEVDPAYWEPEDEDIAAMQNADMILMNGADYAKWVEHVSLPVNTRIDTSTPFRGAYVTIKGGITHSHGDGTVHSHDGLAGTTWLNLEYALLQAEAIRDALLKKLPEHKDVILQNSAALAADLSALDSELKEVAAKIRGKSFVASHPVYQYLARRYKLDIVSVHWEPNIVPDDKGLAELEDIKSDYPVSVMIWEGKPLPESVEILNKAGLTSIVFLPCGGKPESGDFLSVMKENIATLNSLAN